MTFSGTNKRLFISAYYILPLNCVLTGVSTSHRLHTNSSLNIRVPIVTIDDATVSDSTSRLMAADVSHVLRI